MGISYYFLLLSLSQEWADVSIEGESTSWFCQTSGANNKCVALWVEPVGVLCLYLMNSFIQLCQLLEPCLDSQALAPVLGLKQGLGGWVGGPMQVQKLCLFNSGSLYPSWAPSLRLSGAELLAILLPEQVQIHM